MATECAEIALAWVQFLSYLAMGKIRAEKWTLQSSRRLKFDMEDSDQGSAEFASVVH